ncbi:MAG: toxin-antitoxin system HicB family antitoxin [bacterium]
MKKDLNYYLNLNWTYRFEWSNIDNCYVASIAELKGCMSEGKTIEEATMMIKDALLSYIDCKLSFNDEIPEPIKPVDYTGKFVVRTDPENHYKLVQKAKVQGKSLNKIVNEAIEDKLKEAS